MNLSAKNVSFKYYGKKKKKPIFELCSTSLDVPEGKLTAIIGHSGSGKSTLISILAGVLRPEKGDVTIGNADIYSLSDRERSFYRNKNIGVIPQGNSSLKHLTVFENISLPYEMYGDGVPREDIDAILRQFGLIELADEPACGLSGGEQRRLAIVRAIVRKPSIILADEPTGDLDEDNRKNVLSELKKMTMSGTTVLMVTHDKEAEGYADQVFKMENGVLL